MVLDVLVRGPWIYHSLLVVVYYLNLAWAAFRPDETNSILGIDPNAVLTVSVTQKGFQSVSWWDFKISQLIRRIKLVQFPTGNRP